VTPEKHKELAKGFSDFLQSGDETHVESLRARMLKASDDKNYELAAKLRDNIFALDTVLEKSTVVFTDQTDD